MRLFPVAAFLFTGLLPGPVFAQQADIGFFYGTSGFNRYSLEFRVPIAEKYKFRTTISSGKTNGSYIHFRTLDINDSIRTMRGYWTSKSQFADLRFGMQRSIFADRLAVYGDLVAGYSRQERGAATGWETYYMNEDNDSVWYESTYNPYTNASDSEEGRDRARFLHHYFCFGAVLGLNIDVPLGHRFILGVNANYAVIFRKAMSVTVLSNPLGESYNPGPRTLDAYGTMNIGIRYVFGKI